MFIRSVKVAVLAAAFLGMCPAPSFAQNPQGIGNIAVGLSFLGDDGGAGLQAAVSNRIKPLSNDTTLSWVVDASFHRNGDDSLFGNSTLTSILLQGGARVSGVVNGRAEWYGHAMVGFLRQSVGGDLGDLCDLVDENCSDTRVIFTPGIGLAYGLNASASAYAQLDVPIGGDGNTTRFTVGIKFRR